MRKDWSEWDKRGNGRSISMGNIMDIKQLVEEWFQKWESGDFMDLPLSEDFIHESPFGIIHGKGEYLDLVKSNRDKFLGQNFTIHDLIYENDRACIRYTAHQGEDFELEVSEWHYISGSQINRIVAYYHIGEIREERRLK